MSKTTPRSDLLQEFSVRVRAAREAQYPAMTQRDIANALGVSFSAVNLWEQGKAFPGVPLLPGLARLLSVTVDWLTRGVDVLCTNVVPVVTADAILVWSQGVAPDHGVEALMTEGSYLAGTAAAIVVGSSSLESVARRGDYAVVSKAHRPDSGCVVLAALAADSAPVLRRFVQEGGDDLLVADDIRYPTIRLSDARIIGRVTETVRLVTLS